MCFFGFYFTLIRLGKSRIQIIEQTVFIKLDFATNLRKENSKSKSCLNR